MVPSNSAQLTTSLHRARRLPPGPSVPRLSVPGPPGPSLLLAQFAVLCVRNALLRHSTWCLLPKCSRVPSVVYIYPSLQKRSMSSCFMNLLRIVTGVFRCLDLENCAMVDGAKMALAGS